MLAKQDLSYIPSFFRKTEGPKLKTLKIDLLKLQLALSKFYDPTHQQYLSTRVEKLLNNPNLISSLESNYTSKGCYYLIQFVMQLKKTTICPEPKKFSLNENESYRLIKAILYFITLGIILLSTLSLVSLLITALCAYLGSVSLNVISIMLSIDQVIGFTALGGVALLFLMHCVIPPIVNLTINRYDSYNYRCKQEALALGDTFDNECKYGYLENQFQDIINEYNFVNDCDSTLLNK